MLFAIIIAIAALVIIGASVVVLRRDRNEGLVIDRDADTPDIVDISDVAPDAAAPTEAEPTAEAAPRPSFRDRLSTARSSLSGFLGGVFSGGINADTWESLEEALILAVLGFIPGFIVASGLLAGMKKATNLPLAMTVDMVVMVFIGTLVACALSGAIATRRLASADPADLF